MLSPFQRQVTEDTIAALKKTLTGNLLEDAEIMDEIHKMEMRLNGVEPSSGDPEQCEFCSG